ncbi:MAG: hypothetical protein DCF29_03875 [Alphaproteobacteria bacterium]|nr:MAG: hypothetical protein DCF29_03875 [Alphaproteobacteria bacterium]
MKAGATAAVKPGARRRKPNAIADDDQVEEERVAVVLQTSRLTGRNGRPVPRRTTALVTVERALSLMLQGDAREATPAETEAAEDAEAPVYID